MVFIEYAVRAVGLFYAVGSIFLIRQMGVAQVLDHALAALEGKRWESKLVLRHWLLGAVAALTGASGVAALLLSSWAVPLFAANLALQVGWLAWASSAFPPEDAEDALGRRRTFNAAFFFATMTMTVLALFWEGRLRPWDELATAAPVAAATLGYAVYTARHLRGLGGAADDRAGGGDGDSGPLAGP